MALSKGFRLNSAPAPLDFRLAQQGLLARTAAGGPRAGILHSGSADGNILTRSAVALQVTLLDQVVLALARNTAGTDGVDYLTNVGAIVQNVNAPTANSWYVTFWARQNDTTGAGGAADADNLPTFGVTYGAAAASPAIPAAPTGATKIGHLLVPSTATTAQSSGVVYTETIPHTTVIGGRIRYRTIAEMTADIPNVTDGTLSFIRSGDLYYLRGGVWVQVTGDTGWITLTASLSTVQPNAGDPPQYRVLNGFAYLRGQFDAKSGNAPSGTYTSLPTGARPSQRYIDVTYQTTRILINTDGSVQITTANVASYIRLDGVSFPVT